jgi:H/ACA ribonucleoprotein complex subunit 2
MQGDDEKSEGKSYEERLSARNAISKPMAGKKLTKKVYKLVKKGAKAKVVKRGVKEVVKGLKKGCKGLCIIAGDISPIDVIAHLPILCEEMDVAYIYVPSKADLGTAGATKRPTSCILITLKDKKGDFDAQELYDEVLEEVKEAAPEF